jgi:ABC-type sugar transport system ATPase subunit
MADKIKKVVLAYSGGLDTSIIIPWLKETYPGCEVIAISGNVGQASELDGLEEKALKTGASKLYIEDLRKEFIEDFIYPTVKADAKYESQYLLGTSFARPIIAKRIVEIAKAEGKLEGDKKALTEEHDICYGIRPEDIHDASIHKAAVSYEIDVAVAELLGHEYYIHTDFGGVDLVARIPLVHEIKIGDKLRLAFGIEKAHIFDLRNEKRIY